MNNDFVYFELNNWCSGTDYPDAEPFISWIERSDGELCPLKTESFCISNQLCVVESVVDMSTNFCISAKKEWVEMHCPELLTKYTKFLCTTDSNGNIYGKCGKFLPYSLENVGHFYYGKEDD